MGDLDDKENHDTDQGAVIDSEEDVGDKGGEHSEK